MKKLAKMIVILALIPNLAFADCDFAKGITPGPNNTFVYSQECHLKVGQLVQDNKTKDAQIADLNKAIQLKDLALLKADERTQLWMDTSDKLINRVNTIDETYKKNEWFYFGLGVLTTFAAGYAIARGVK
jgi:hypothetical protein